MACGGALRFSIACRPPCRRNRIVDCRDSPVRGAIGCPGFVTGHRARQASSRCPPVGHQQAHAAAPAERICRALSVHPDVGALRAGRPLPASLDPFRRASSLFCWAFRSPTRSFALTKLEKDIAVVSHADALSPVRRFCVRRYAWFLRQRRPLARPSTERRFYKPNRAAALASAAVSAIKNIANMAIDDRPAGQRWRVAWNSRARLPRDLGSRP